MNTPIRVCPRCGHPYNYIRERKINGRVYLYAVHYCRDGGGKVRVMECYLGPKDQYEYVTKMHVKEGLIFKGLIEKERIIQYLDSIIDYLSTGNVDKELAQLVIERIEKLEELKSRLRQMILEA